MTEAQLLARLESCARYWLLRYKHLCGGLEANELVAEGWLAWQRSKTWIRAEGAIRDKLRAEHAAWKQGRKHDVLGQGEPGTVQVAAAEELPDNPLCFPDTLSARERLVLQTLADGRTLASVSQSLGLASTGGCSEYAARGRRKIEAARIKERRQAAGMARRRPIPNLGKPYVWRKT